MYPCRMLRAVICKRRIKLKKWILATLLALSSVSAFGSNAIGQITEVRGGAHYGSAFTFKVSPEPSGLIACNTLDSRGHYVIDTNKAGGKETLSLVLTAYAAKKNVQLWGTNACIAAGALVGEELETIAIQ